MSSTWIWVSRCDAYAYEVLNDRVGWSLAVEQQAYDRVHRLGQNRDVFVQRLVIADTVEDRILALQERKKSLADGCLGEGEKGKLGSEFDIVFPCWLRY